MNPVIVSAANDKYYRLLRGLLQSIDEHRPGPPIPIAILDVGLNDQQRAELTQAGHPVFSADWDFDFPAKAAIPPHMKALFFRPFLPRHLPQYDLYLYVDADCWVQDWFGMQLLLDGAEHFQLAIVPELDRAYRGVYGDTGVREKYKQCVTRAFGEETWQAIHNFPMINSGVFAMRRDAPHWNVWGKHLSDGLQRTEHFLIELAAMNLTIYQDQLAGQFLPAWCNWITSQAMPSYSPQGKFFHEPFLPFQKISLVHLTADNKSSNFALPVSATETVETPLDYLSLKERALI